MKYEMKKWIKRGIFFAIGNVLIGLYQGMVWPQSSICKGIIEGVPTIAGQNEAPIKIGKWLLVISYFILGVAEKIKDRDDNFFL